MPNDCSDFLLKQEVLWDIMDEWLTSGLDGRIA